MNGNTTTILLSASGVLILGLCSVLWWFVRDRMKARERKEDLLERRLSSGAQTMQNISTEIKNIQNLQVQQSADFIRKQDFNGYKAEHEEQHEKLGRTLDAMKDGQADLRDAISQMGTRVESAMESMTDMLSKIVTIPTDPKERE